MVLITLVQFHEIPAPTPDADNQVTVFLRVRLGVQEGLLVEGIEL
jgi:hypothetical protein